MSEKNSSGGLFGCFLVFAGIAFIGVFLFVACVMCSTKQEGAPIEERSKKPTAEKSPATVEEGTDEGIDEAEEEGAKPSVSNVMAVLKSAAIKVDHGGLLDAGNAHDLFGPLFEKATPKDEFEAHDKDLMKKKVEDLESRKEKIKHQVFVLDTMMVFDDYDFKKKGYPLELGWPEKLGFIYLVPKGTSFKLEKTVEHRGIHVHTYKPKLTHTRYMYKEPDLDKAKKFKKKWLEIQIDTQTQVYFSVLGSKKIEKKEQYVDAKARQSQKLLGLEPGTFTAKVVNIKILAVHVEHEGQEHFRFLAVPEDEILAICEAVPE